MKFPSLRLNKYFNFINFIKGIFSVYGDFGVGKTTFALQTAINSAKNGKNVIYVYTKPNFPSEKIMLINNESKEALDNFLFIQTTNFDELNRIVFNFEFLILKLLKENQKNYHLIVIDSITNLYRLELNIEKKEKNYNLSYQLNQILANLAYLNEFYNIEILIVNEVSRKSFNDEIIQVQSGGKVMEFWVDYNLNIIKTIKLNERKLLFTDISQNKIVEWTSTLKEKGFE
ncbi:MAG: AAA family ATPase [Promethearchaeota archaeon]